MTTSPSPTPRSFGDPVIEFKGVTLFYGSDDVVRNVDLTVRRGEVKVVLGPSGVGKSTLLKAILGILKPRSGKIMIHGEDITHLSEADLAHPRRHMAMVFQNGALFDSMTVGDNVSYRMREHNLLASESIEGRVQEVLKFVGLQGARKLRPSQLSGGMRKRVAIARAIAPSPEIILFDEPTVGLDPVNHYNIEQLILKLKANKTTMIIVTHDVESAFELGDTIIMIHEGRFIFEGTSEEIKASRDKRIISFLDPARAAMLT